MYVVITSVIVSYLISMNQQTQCCSSVPVYKVIVEN